MSWIHSIRGYVRVILDTRPTDREFRRIGLDDETLVARVPDIDATRPPLHRRAGKHGQRSARPVQPFSPCCAECRVTRAPMRWLLNSMLRAAAGMS